MHKAMMLMKCVLSILYKGSKATGKKIDPRQALKRKVRIIVGVKVIFSSAKDRSKGKTPPRENPKKKLAINKTKELCEVT